MLARLSDHVTVVGKHPEKLALLADAWHRHGTGVGSHRRALARTSSWTAPDRRPGLPTALRLVRPRGTIVLKTTVAGTQTLAWAPFVIDEVTLVGSQLWSVRSGAQGARARRGERAPLISERFDSGEGYRRARTRTGEISV